MSHLTVEDIPESISHDSYKSLVQQILDYWIDNKSRNGPVFERLREMLENAPSAGDIEYLRNLLIANTAIPKRGAQKRPREESDYCQIPIPKYWSPDLNTSLSDYNEVLLHPNSDEYKRVATFFYDTIPGSESDARENEKKLSLAVRKYNEPSKISKIYRIENMKTWIQYNIEKLYLQEKNRGNANERFLFHGTSRKDNIHGIIKNGFSKAALSKHLYGKGFYFSPHASYSADYTSDVAPSNFEQESGREIPLTTDGDATELAQLMHDAQEMRRWRVLLFCRVLCGKETRVHESKYADANFAMDGGDSHVSIKENLGTRCIFHHARAYPEYLIFFHRAPEGTASAEGTPDVDPSTTNVEGRMVNVKFENVEDMQHYGSIPLIPLVA